MSVLFPFRSLPSKIPLNTSPKAPLPNKLEAKKKFQSVFSCDMKCYLKKTGDVIVEITHVLI